ncbi:MAG: DNA polymerase III subunit delta' [Oscillospiraceae bacterium]|nr:DNA polymerase III subunit delta' [Oscillospiraceae bacterium]
MTAFAKTPAAARIREAACCGALSHALIFSGSGDGLAAARYAACAYECTAAEKPCLTCDNCRKVIAGIHPDVTFVRDDEHAEIAVDIVRAARTDAFIRPNEGARKVYIFDDCARLNDKDQNVLLKIVEEGPAYAAFIFLAENASSLLQTIRSRCVEFQLAPRRDAGADNSTAEEFALLLARGKAAERAAYLTALEQKKTARDELALLFSAARALFVEALAVSIGADEARGTAREITSRLTKQQILGTIDILDTYRKHCNYNVGVGPLLGGLAVELEDIL